MHIYFTVGTKGLPLNSGAVARYHLTAEYRSTFLQQLHQVTNVSDRAAIHHDLTPSHMKKDEYSVQALEDLLENNWTIILLQEKLSYSISPHGLLLLLM